MSTWQDWTTRIWQRTARGVRTWMPFGAYQEFRIGTHGVEVFSAKNWRPVARCQFRMQAAEALRQLGG